MLCTMVSLKKKVIMLEIMKQKIDYLEAKGPPINKIQIGKQNEISKQLKKKKKQANKQRNTKQKIS